MGQCYVRCLRARRRKGGFENLLVPKESRLLALGLENDEVPVLVGHGRVGGGVLSVLV